ncbi:peroxiredoxin-like family protein [Methylocystis sp. SC2]|uniref:peroxiredoxin-like family protein n=1 Tax=Methylocystis sp. (strain SC2) TaxID=187303 RepID=UPI00030187EF|nr:peroxiredoxin-like family protein [Methylocystis sp. SC2]
MEVSQLLAALEDAFLRIGSENAPLGDKLKYIADEVRRLSPVFAGAVDNFVNRLEQVAAGSLAPRIGEKMPSFLLPDEQGRLVSLDALLRAGPVAIAFIRGHWCPYCRLNAAGLAQIEDAMKPVQLVAISAETRKYTREIKREAKARFPFLSDVDNGYALALNLAIWVPDDMSSLIAAAGWDVPCYQGGSAWILPVPSVFLLDREGVVRFRHVDPDYRRRLEPSALIAAAADMASSSAKCATLSENHGPVGAAQ